MATSFIDPRTYGVLSDDEKAFKLRQLYPQMFVNSDDPTYPGGFGQNIDYSGYGNGATPAATATPATATPAPASSPVGSPGTAGGGDAATKLASEMGPNSPGASQVPPSFVEKYGGWGGEVQGGATSTTADGTPDPMGGWGGVPNATPPKTLVSDQQARSRSNIDPGIYREAQDKVKDEGIYRQPPPNAGKDEGIYMGGPLGVPDTTPTPAPPATPAGPPMAIPKSSGQLTSPTGALGSIVPALREPALPSTVPPAPARRLQPPQDRVALYQKLRPYPGMSRSEKMSNMIAAAFASASQPGTGNDFKDAARAFAQGNTAYQGIKDYDRATRANYATSVLGQLAAQEEAARKGADTEADIYKKYGEGYKEYSQGGNLQAASRNMLEFTGPASLKTAEAAVQRAATEDWDKRTALHNAPEGTTIVRRDPRTGLPIKVETTAKTYAPDAAETKINANVRAMYIYEQLNGGPLTAEQSTQAWRAMNNMDPKVMGGTGALAQAWRIGNIEDPVERARQTKLLMQAGHLAQAVSPPQQTVLQMPLGETVKGKGISELTQRHVRQFTGKDGVVDYQKYIAAAMNGELDKTGYTQVRDVDWQNSLMQAWQEQNQARKTSGPPKLDSIKDRTGAANKKKEEEAAKLDPAAAAAVQSMAKMVKERKEAAKRAEANKGLK